MEKDENILFKKNFYIKSHLTEKLYSKKEKLSPLKRAAFLLFVFMILPAGAFLWIKSVIGAYKEAEGIPHYIVLCIIVFLGCRIFLKIFKEDIPRGIKLLKNTLNKKEEDNPVFTLSHWDFDSEDDKKLFEEKKKETFENIKKDFKSFLYKNNKSYPKLSEFSVSENTEIKDEKTGKKVMLYAHEIYNLKTDIVFLDSPLIYSERLEHHKKYPKICVIHEIEGINPTEHSLYKIGYDYREEKNLEKIIEKYNDQ